jgi:hypothetical protein
MDIQLSPLQTLILWRLLADGGEGFANDLKPKLSAKDRRVLESVGLVENSSRKKSDRKGARATSYLVLTEQGWAWAADHLDAPVPTRSPASGPILHAIMSRLKRHLKQTGGSLADFILSSDEADPVEAVVELSQQVLSVYLKLSQGRPGVRVYLADLRRELSERNRELSREELDSELLNLERLGRLVLYPLDNPQEIRPEDSAAAIPNSAGDPRHIIYITDFPENQTSLR